MEPILTKKRTYKGKVSIKRLRPFEKNPRKMPNQEMGALERSILNWGFVEPVVVDENYLIIGGHQRVIAADSLGIKAVPVMMVHGLTFDEKTALNIALNKIHGEWDEVKLSELLADLSERSFDLDLTGFTKADIDKLLAKTTMDVVGEDNYITPKEPKYKIVKGEIWNLGNHRLMCGDSTSGDDMAMLMDGRKVDIVVTSPPYFNARTYAHWEDFQSYLDDMEKCIKNIIRYKGDRFLLCWNICHINDKSGSNDIPSHMSVLMAGLELNFFDRIIWKKSGGVFDCPRSQHIEKGHYYPAYQFEDILIYGTKHPSFHIGDKRLVRGWQTNVWDMQQVRTNKEDHNEGHPAQYPVELPYRCIISYTKRNAIILDPFAGSGTTLIAAEQLERKCYMMEIDPIYCSVIIERWETLTGQRATLIK